MHVNTKPFNEAIAMAAVALGRRTGKSRLAHQLAMFSVRPAALAVSRQRINGEWVETQRYVRYATSHRDNFGRGDLLVPPVVYFSPLKRPA